MSEQSFVVSPGPAAEEEAPAEEDSLLVRLVRRPDLLDCVASHLGHRDYVCAAFACACEKWANACSRSDPFANFSGSLCAAAHATLTSEGV